MGTKYREGDWQWKVPDELCPPCRSWAEFRAYHHRLLAERRAGELLKDMADTGQREADG